MTIISLLMLFTPAFATTGCMEHGYGTYDPTADVNDPRMCKGANACHPSRIEHGAGACANCQSDTLYGACDAACTEENCGNVGFVHPSLDRIVARRVEKDEIRADGDLSDWASHPRSMRYEMPLFATETGDIVMYENYNGGIWDGRDDFWLTAMLAWDDSYLYLAIEVIDDDQKQLDDDYTRPSGQCYNQGVQVAFEVGGDASIDREGNSLLGVLQAKRSADAAQSRIKLINLGLNPSQSYCERAPVDDMNADDDCCVNYEDAAGGEWIGLCGGAALRDNERKITTYELLFSKYDLLGTSRDAALIASQWNAGLVFGFSFLVNDGDGGSSQQRGWAGYYPHAIVYGKDVNKVGTVLLDSGERTPHANDDAGGVDGFSFAIGMAVFAGALVCACGVFLFVRRPVGGQLCIGHATEMFKSRRDRPQGANSVQLAGSGDGATYVAPWQGQGQDESGI